jgi:hypothetical protein
MMAAKKGGEGNCPDSSMEWIREVDSSVQCQEVLNGDRITERTLVG